VRPSGELGQSKVAMQIAALDVRRHLSGRSRSRSLSTAIATRHEWSSLRVSPIGGSLHRMFTWNLTLLGSVVNIIVIEIARANAVKPACGVARINGPFRAPYRFRPG
jgi:hypothetical protein